MNIKLLRLLLTPILWAALSVFATGQSSNSASSVQFSCTVWKALPYPALFYRQGGEYLPLKLLPRQRSEMYSLRENPALELYITNEQPDAEIEYKLVGTAPLRQGTKQMLFLIQESAEGAKLPLSILGVDDSLGTFPVGSFRFLNFSKFPLQVQIGTKSSNLSPKDIKVVKPVIPELGGFIPFLVKDMKGNIGFQTRLFGQPRGRKMVFILPPKKKSEKLSVLFLPQIIPPPPPESTR